MILLHFADLETAYHLFSQIGWFSIEKIPFWEELGTFLFSDFVDP